MADRSGYIGRAPGDSSVIIARQTFEPTGIQTDFTFASGYTPGYIDVYLNGSRLIVASDYTATDGSVVGLTTNAINGDVLECVAYKAFNLGSIDSAAGNFTVGGDLTVNGTSNLTLGAGTSVSYATTSFGLSGSPDIAVNNITGAAVTFTGAADVGGKLTVTGIDNDGQYNIKPGGEFFKFENSSAWSLSYDDGGSGSGWSYAINANKDYVKLYGPGGSGSTVVLQTITDGVNIGTGITMYASSGIVSATAFYGDVTGDVSGSAATVTGAVQSGITSTGTLTTISIDGPYKQKHVTITPSATPTVDLSLGNYFTLTQNAAVTSWTFSNPPGNTFSFSFVVELANGGHATAWLLSPSGTVKWPAATAPTLAASKTHLIIFVTDDGGTTYRASSIVDYTT